MTGKTHLNFCCFVKALLLQAAAFADMVEGGFRRMTATWLERSHPR